MKVYTKSELQEMAEGFLAEEGNESFILTDWMLVHESIRVYMVILFRKSGEKGIFSLQKEFLKF